LRKPSPATVMAFLALVFAMGGFAVAANQSAKTKKTQIRACYAKKTGELRVVKGKKKCAKGEKRLAWNKRGRRGGVGPAGPPGARGERGQTGPTGPAGENALTDGSVETADLADGAVTADKIDPSALTDQALGLQIVTSETPDNGTSPKSTGVNCPGDKQLVGGGGGAYDGLAPMTGGTVAITYSGPSIGDGWYVSAYETGGTPTWALWAWAICIRD